MTIIIFFYRLLLAYLAFVLYLFLANWLRITNVASLPLSSIPVSYPFFMMLLGIVAATVLNAARKRQSSPKNKPAQ